MKERFLPIGTIVILKNGSKKIMINSYCIFPKGKEIKDGEEVEAKTKMYEYGGCVYPEGVVDPTVMLGFNHDDIDKIIHLGYQNDAQKKFSDMLNANYDEVKSKFEIGDLTTDQLEGKEE